MFYATAETYSVVDGMTSLTREDENIFRGLLTGIVSVVKS